MGDIDVKKLKKGKTPAQGDIIEYFFGKAKDPKAIPDSRFDDIAFDLINENGARAKAVAKFGIDESELCEFPEMFFWGFENEDIKLGDIYAARISDKGILRTTVCSTTWLFFGEKQMYVYHSRFDLCSDASKEIVKDYFYKDIANFEISTETTDKIVVTRKSGLFKGKDIIDKKTAEYNTFAINAQGDRFDCSISGVLDAEEKINELKNRLRDKKAR